MGRKSKDLTNQKFGSLTVIQLLDRKMQVEIDIDYVNVIVEIK